MATECPECGNEASPEEQYCSQCGQELDHEPTASPGVSGAVKDEMRSDVNLLYIFFPAFAIFIFGTLLLSYAGDGFLRPVLNSIGALGYLIGVAVLGLVINIILYRRMGPQTG